MIDIIGCGEKLTELIISRLYKDVEIRRQVPICDLIKKEDFVGYGKEFSKHKCDLAMMVKAFDGTVQNLAIEVNYKHHEKAAQKWRRVFSPDITLAGSIPVTIDDYDCRSLFKKDSENNHAVTWNDFRDIVNQLEKARVRP